MSLNTLAAAAALSDPALLARLEFLVGREREARGQVIAHLAELDTRTTLLAAGYGSLFAYCTKALRYSEHAAYNRIEAARMARRFPLVLELLEEGSVNLTTVRLLGPHLTPENHRQVLGEASGLSKREVAEIVVRLAPRPDVPASVRKLPRPRSAAAVADKRDIEPAPAAPVRVALAAAQLVVPAAHEVRAVVAPLAPERYRVQFTVGRDTHDRLRRLQDLLRREIPDGDPAAIFDRALALLERDVTRRKRAKAAHPRSGTRSRTSTSRHVPAEVARGAWARDGDRCAFVSPAGRRCDTRVYLELHHLRAYMTGGEATVENIAVRCRRHNLYEAERVFAPIREARGRDTQAIASESG